MAKSITSANSVLMLTATTRGVASSITGSTGVSALGSLSSILGVSTRIEGWAADSAFSIDQQETAVVNQGVDGKVHFGWVPSLVQFSLNLMPDTDSQNYIGNLFEAQKIMRETLQISGELFILAIGQKIALTNGAITRYTPIPSHNRTLAAQTTQMTFESMTPAEY